jgi:chitinase
MKITAMDMTPYTHIHLAFGSVTSSYTIDVSQIQVQWESFIQMSGFKKILSLGGWSFSTEPATYTIFRDAVKPANQDTFAANIALFVQLHNLDGIDIDWECKLATAFSTKNLVNLSHRSYYTRYPGIPPGM